MRWLIHKSDDRLSRFGIDAGIRVGWRIFHPDGTSVDVWWGSSKDDTALASLVEDARNRGYEFERVVDVAGEASRG